MSENKQAASPDAQTQEGQDAIVCGEKIWLRAFEREDLRAYLQLANDVDVAYWAGFGGPQSSENIASWYERRVLAEHGRDAHYFVICPLGSRHFIGTAWLWNFGTHLGGPEFSIAVSDKSRWGSGVGTDATQAVTDFGFGFLDIQRIWLTTMVENERARRAFEKAGFVVEGRLRACERKRGNWHDSWLMAMLRADWEALDRPRSWDYGGESGVG